jgi:hypothetical protein
MRRAWPALLLPGLLASPVAGDGRVTPRSRTPIRDSIDRVTERVVLAHLGPCQLAGREGLPCFPVTIEEQGPHLSVADAMRSYNAKGGPAPAAGAPTVAEIQGQMAAAPAGPPPSASGGVGLDPVCTARNLWRKVSGKGTTYYLYRAWDARGERPLLTDHPLDPHDYAANPDFRFESIGRFDSECAAVSAWNQALRDAVDHRPATGTQTPPDEPS